MRRKTQFQPNFWPRLSFKDSEFVRNVNHCECNGKIVYKLQLCFHLQANFKIIQLAINKPNFVNSCTFIVNSTTTTATTTKQQHLVTECPSFEKARMKAHACIRKENIFMSKGQLTHQSSALGPHHTTPIRCELLLGLIY